MEEFLGSELPPLDEEAPFEIGVVDLESIESLTGIVIGLRKKGR